MKITNEELRQIISEEIQSVLNEDDNQQALVSKIVELDPDVEDALDEYILSSEGDWESDYVNQIGSMGLEAVARDWLNDYEQGNLGDALAAFDAQDKEDAFYLQEQEAQEGKEIVDKAEELVQNPKVQAMFDKIENDPALEEFRKKLDAAVQNVMNELPMEEEKYKTGKLAKGPENMDMQKVGIPGALAATAWVGAGGLKTGAGAGLIAALTPALGAAGATLTGIGAAIAAPLAVAYLIDVMRDK